MQKATLFGQMAWPALAFWAAVSVYDGLLLSGHVGADFLTFMGGARSFDAAPLSLYGPDVLATMLGFLYPPPSIMVFLPFLSWPEGLAYHVWVGLIYAAAAAALALWLWLLRDAGPQAGRVGTLDWVVLFAFGLAARPVFENAWDGQVNTIVLLLCVLYVALVALRRPSLAGAILAVGCWIKLYPALLLLHGLRYADRRRFLAGFMAAGLAIPLAALPVVPPALYVRYFTEALPTLSQHLMINISNQSAAAFITRLGIPIAEAVQTYHAYPIDTLTRLGVLAAVALCLAAMMGVSTLTKRDNRLVAASCIALIAPMAPLGWGHTYVYILPLLTYTGYTALACRTWPAIGCVAGALAVITLPPQHAFTQLSAMPEWLQNVVYSRDLFATIGLLAVAWLLRARALRSLRVPLGQAGQTGPTLGAGGS